MGYRIDEIRLQEEDMTMRVRGMYDSAVEILLEEDPNDPFAILIVDIVHMWERHNAWTREEHGVAIGIDDWSDELQVEMDTKHAKPFHYDCEVDGHVIKQDIHNGEQSEIVRYCIHCDYDNF